MGILRVRETNIIKYTSARLPLLTIIYSILLDERKIKKIFVLFCKFQIILLFVSMKNNVILMFLLFVIFISFNLNFEIYVYQLG
jgi:hypothetical protein